MPHTVFTLELFAHALLLTDDPLYEWPAPCLNIKISLHRTQFSQQKRDDSSLPLTLESAELADSIVLLMAPIFSSAIPFKIQDKTVVEPQKKISNIATFKTCHLFRHFLKTVCFSPQASNNAILLFITCTFIEKKKIFFVTLIFVCSYCRQLSKMTRDEIDPPVPNMFDIFSS